MGAESGKINDNKENNGKEKIILVWIDKKVNNNENKGYQNQLLSINKVDLKCFENVSKAINFLKQIEFKRTIIITSGNIYPEFYKKFKDNINNLKIAPRIIIFTFNKENFINSNINNNLPINDLFYNSGGVVDKFSNLKEYILSKKIFNRNNNENNNENNDLGKDLFFFEYIKEKEQLILPLYISEFVKIPTNNEIQKFNEYLLNKYNEPSINNLISQLIEISNIPISIISKYWIHAYTVESNFYKNMNDDLIRKNNIKYLTYIHILYEAVQKRYIKSECTKKLYSGAFLLKNEFNKIVEYINKKNKDLPAIIISGKSFFSFSDNENVAIKFKEKKKKRIEKEKNKELIAGLYILNNYPKKDLCITNASIKEYSYYKTESEILFFPFSSFEIKKAEIINDNEFIIELNYLGEYQKIFKGENQKELLKKVPEKSEIAQSVLSTNIIDSNLKLPNWAEELNQESNNIKLILDSLVKEVKEFKGINYDLGKLLINCNIEDIKALVYKAKKEGKKKEDMIDYVFERISLTLPQDIIVNMHLINFSQKEPEVFIKIMEFYNKGDHSNFANFLKKTKNNKNIVYTFSNNLDEIYNVDGIDNPLIGIIEEKNIKNILLSSIKSENEFAKQLDDFFNQDKQKVCIIKILPDEANLMNYIIYFIENKEKDFEKKKKKLFVFIIYLERILKNKINKTFRRDKRNNKKMSR